MLVVQSHKAAIQNTYDVHQNIRHHKQTLDEKSGTQHTDDQIEKQQVTKL